MFGNVFPKIVPFMR